VGWLSGRSDSLVTDGLTNREIPTLDKRMGCVELTDGCIWVSEIPLMDFELFLFTHTVVPIIYSVACARGDTPIFT
jgi:hypothetical protein